MNNSRNRLHVALSIVAILHMLPGCAGTPRPIIDTKGADMDQYPADLAECGQFAEEVDIAGGVVRSAAIGAVVGAAMGAISGDVGPAAGFGAIGGGAGAGLEEGRTRQSVVKECLRGRGYRVLN